MYVVALCLLLLTVEFCSAESSLWRKKFEEHRRETFGSIENHSADEVAAYYALEGEHRNADRQTIDSHWLPENEPMIETKEKSAESRPRSKPRRGKKAAAAPVKQLLAKSREALASGQLEEARRFYALVLKVDPDSAEAKQKLDLIEQQLN